MTLVRNYSPYGLGLFVNSQMETGQILVCELSGKKIELQVVWTKAVEDSIELFTCGVVSKTGEINFTEFAPLA